MATPGRLIDLVRSGAAGPGLRRVTLLVVDEVDRCFDLGFEAQVRRSPVQQRGAVFPKIVDELVLTCHKQTQKCQSFTVARRDYPAQLWNRPPERLCTPSHTAL